MLRTVPAPHSKDRHTSFYPGGAAAGNVIRLVVKAASKSVDSSARPW